MRKSRKYVFAPLIVILILAGICWTADPWIWLVITLISGVLPGTSRKAGWNFLRYFILSLIAMALYYLIAPADKEVLRVMGELIPVGGAGYVIVVLLTSAVVYAFLSLTFRSVFLKIAGKRG